MYCAVEVISNELLCAGYLRMAFKAPEVVRSALPGQFVMVKCLAPGAPFFMRPFSINSINARTGTLELLYKIVGKGTEVMSAMRPGDRVHVLGPLGNGFPLQPRYKRIAVLGRGIGAAPMRFLVEYAAEKGISADVLISASREEHLFDKEIFRSMSSVRLFMTADPNVVTADQLRIALEAGEPIDAAYTCGSRRVARKLAELQTAYHLDCYASLEEHMACGTGACHGCAHHVTDEDGETHEIRICKEGPVFPVGKAVALNV